LRSRRRIPLLGALALFAFAIAMWTLRPRESTPVPPIVIAPPQPVPPPEAPASPPLIEPTPAPVPVAAPAHPARPKRPPPPPQTGELRFEIQNTDGQAVTAAVFVDDQRIDGDRLPVSAGTHSVRINSRGYVAQEFEVHVIAGEHRTVRRILQQ
jgi:outer membrane biosynthesis protein TonB